MKNQDVIPKKKDSAKKVAAKLALLMASALLYTIAIECFISGNGFVTGGVWGISLMIEHSFGFPNRYMIFLLNVPLIIVAVVFLGWRFASYTLFFVGMQTIFSTIVKLLNVSRFSADPFLALIAAGVLMGVGLALCLKAGGCTGGTDIISVIIQKKNASLNVPWVIFIVNAVVISAAYFVYGGLSAVIMSLVLEFVASKVSDTVLSGFVSAIRFEIVTEKGEEVRDAIVNRLDRGATVLDARGGYTNAPVSVFVCLIRKRQVPALKKLLKEVDPNAFAHVINVSSVFGKGFVPLDDLD